MSTCPFGMSQESPLAFPVWPKSLVSSPAAHFICCGQSTRNSATHSAAAQLLDDAVVRDGLADKLGVGRHWREMLCRNRERVSSKGLNKSS